MDFVGHKIAFKHLVCTEALWTITLFKSVSRLVLCKLSLWWTCVGKKSNLTLLASQTVCVDVVSSLNISSFLPTHLMQLQRVQIKQRCFTLQMKTNQVLLTLSLISWNISNHLFLAHVGGLADQFRVLQIHPEQLEDNKSTNLGGCEPAAVTSLAEIIKISPTLGNERWHFAATRVRSEWEWGFCESLVVGFGWMSASPLLFLYLSLKKGLQTWEEQELIPLH